MSLSVVQDQDEARCEYVGEDGEQCRVSGSLVRADGKCWTHSEDPEVVRERDQARRLGGARTAARNSKGIDPDELPPLDGPKSAARRADLISRAALIGRISGAQAQAGLRGINEYLKAYEAGKLKEERDELLAAVNELRRNGGRR